MTFLSKETQNGTMETVSLQSGVKDHWCKRLLCKRQVCLMSLLSLFGKGRERSFEQTNLSKAPNLQAGLLKVAAIISLWKNFL